MAKDVQKKSQKAKAQTSSQLMNSPEFKAAVGGAMKDIEAHSKIYRAASGLSEEEARKKVAQMYYANMQWAEEPVAAAKHLLAQTMMGQQMKMELDPEALLDTDQWAKILDTVRKTIKLVGEMEGKTVNHKVQLIDDDASKGFEFIDVEES